MRIGLYGGSFNPVHLGHARVAKRALAELGLDRLVVLPAACNPFKAGVPPPMGSLADARRLLLLAAAFVEDGRIEVDDRELRRGGVSYAIDTVREFAAENPGAELFFIIGEDSLAGLERWKDYAELVKLCKFKAFPRTPESSTEVRRRLAAGEDVDGLVDERVLPLLMHPVEFNSDAALVATVRRGLKAKGGYCPCRLPKTPENVCPCAEFRAQLEDGGFHGLCHCRLYLKP